LTQEHTQLRGVFLNMAHVIKQERGEGHFSPGENTQPLSLLAGQTCDYLPAFGAAMFEIG
jgi:hypothetical protein